MFENKYGNWPLAYHGTKINYVEDILRAEKLLPAKVDAYKGQKPQVYFSPSIEYCGHNRYAQAWAEAGKWWQIVFQVRLNPDIPFSIKPGTLPGVFQTCKGWADPNFDNKELEWVMERPDDARNLEWMRCAYAASCFG